MLKLIELDTKKREHLLYDNFYIKLFLELLHKNNPRPKWFHSWISPTILKRNKIL